MQHIDKAITAFTLNYSGILDSPYEFYSSQYQKEERQISEVFHSLLLHLPNYDPKTFKWDVGKIDQLYQRQRYTPIYNKEVGVINGKLINREEFERQWDQIFWLIDKPEFTSEHKKNMKLFDYLTYCTLVIHSNCLPISLEIKFEQCSAEKYAALQQKYHDKSFVCQDKKINKTIAVLNKRQVDIIFLQQTNHNFRKAISQCGKYHLVSSPGIDSAILVRKESFTNLTPEINLQFQTPNWNDDSIWCKLGSLILASVHLSSKKQKNEKQVSKFLKDIRKLKQKYPNYHILIGIDANSFIQSKNDPMFHAFPTKEEVATTFKERTWMQAQVNKANTVARSCKDHLISDLNLFQCEVTLISGSNINLLIPTQMHPYDHYVVASQLHTTL